MQLLHPLTQRRGHGGQPLENQRASLERGSRLFRPHFGDKSCRQAKGELLDEEGDTPSIFPGESVEEPTLLRLPSNRSGEWLRRTEAASALLDHQKR